MPEEKNSGWFRNRRSGQVFEAEGYQYAEALKNRDLEEVDDPDDQPGTPSSRVVALRERLDQLGLSWRETDDEDAMNRVLDETASKLRDEAKSLGIKALPNWRPETIAAKIKLARDEKAAAKKGKVTKSKAASVPEPSEPPSAPPVADPNSSTSPADPTSPDTPES